MIKPEKNQYKNQYPDQSTQTLKTDSKKLKDTTYGAVLNEVISATKDVFLSEVNLFFTELQQIQPRLIKHMTQISVFGMLMALSVIPFIAFLVLGLGELLNGQYWLSSLIVSFVLMLVGAPLVLQALAKIKNEDLKFTQTKRSLQDILQVSNKSFDKIKTGSKGSSYEPKLYN